MLPTGDKSGELASSFESVVDLDLYRSMLGAAAFVLRG